jgi:hypothetical protein
MIRHFGALPSSLRVSDIVQDIKARDASLVLKHEGLKRGVHTVVSMQALSYWLVKKLVSTPDGIDSLADNPPAAASNVQSPLYNACLETLRTSKGELLSAEEVATRLHFDLGENRRRGLRQMRRMLQRVMRENGGRIRRDVKNRTLYGFR